MSDRDPQRKDAALADIAAATGFDLERVHIAFTRALMGDFAMLMVLGAQVTCPFPGTVDITWAHFTVRTVKTPTTITDAIIQISEQKFKGAHERLLDTLGGRLATMDEEQGDE